jgi:hypothetical protein
MTRLRKKINWSNFLAAGIVFLFVVLGIISIVCSGCSAPLSAVQTSPRAAQAHQAPLVGTSQTGLVDVVFVNPNLGIWTDVFLFDGNEEVKIIPDPRNGQWQFNRPAIAKFTVDPAHGNNWWKEKWVKLPANSSYSLFIVGKRFWGGIVGRPSVYYLRTGSDPFAFQFSRHTPRGYTLVNCGACLFLPTFWQDSGSMNLEFVITPGSFLEAGFSQIFGR